MEQMQKKPLEKSGGRNKGFQEAQVNIQAVLVQGISQIVRGTAQELQKFIVMHCIFTEASAGNS